jgi:peptidoglycan/xylan/chitin deacetylase (PgdA/CDA1 family)
MTYEKGGESLRMSLVVGAAAALCCVAAYSNHSGELASEQMAPAPITSEHATSIPTMIPSPLLTAEPSKAIDLSPAEHAARIQRTVLSPLHVSSTYLARLAKDVLAPTKGENGPSTSNKPANVLSVLRADYGTDFGLSAQNSTIEATAALTSGNKFVDITNKIKPEDLAYLPKGLLVIQSQEQRGYTLAISTGPDTHSEFQGRSGLANASGIKDVNMAINDGEVQKVLAPLDAPVQQVMSPTVIDAVPTKTNEIALTFDADMTPDMLKMLQSGQVKTWYNKEVIDVLEQTHTPATIFLTGLWATHYPDLAKQLAKNPLFEIGDHSYKHYAFTGNCYGLPSIANGEDSTEISNAQNAIKATTGLTPTLFRFAGLCHDNFDVQAVMNARMTIVDGTASGDAGNPDTQNIINTVLNEVHPGSIIVFHMHGGGGFTTSYAPHSGDAIKQIIPALQDKYKFVTVSKLLADAY